MNENLETKYINNSTIRVVVNKTIEDPIESIVDLAIKVSNVDYSIYSYYPVKLNFFSEVAKANIIKELQKGKYHYHAENICIETCYKDDYSQTTVLTGNNGITLGYTEKLEDEENTYIFNVNNNLPFTSIKYIQADSLSEFLTKLNAIVVEYIKDQIAFFDNITVGMNLT